jgi:hypothetical protein
VVALLHALESRDSGSDLGKLLGGYRVGDLLEGEALHEAAYVEPTGVLSGLAGGEHVVGTRGLVAVSDVCLLSEEEGAVVAQPLMVPVQLLTAAEDLEVLAGNLVAQFAHLLARLHQRDLAIVAPCDDGSRLWLRCLEIGQHLRHEFKHSVRHCA